MLPAHFSSSSSFVPSSRYSARSSPAASFNDTFNSSGSGDKDDSSRSDQNESPDPMSCHVYARSFKDPLLAFTNLPSSRELVAQLGTESPVKYLLCVPSVSSRYARPVPLQPLIRQPHAAPPEESVSPNSQNSASSSSSRPEYVEPPKRPSAKSLAAAARKRKAAAAAPLAMNADHEASDEFVLPPVAKQPRDTHRQQQPHHSGGLAPFHRQQQQLQLPRQQPGRSVSRGSMGSSTCSNGSSAGSPVPPPPSSSPFHRQLHLSQQQSGRSSVSLGSPVLPPSSSPFPSPPEEEGRKQMCTPGGYQMPAPSPIPRDDSMTRLRGGSDYSAAAYRRMVAEQEAKQQQRQLLPTPRRSQPTPPPSMQQHQPLLPVQRQLQQGIYRPPQTMQPHQGLLAPMQQQQLQQQRVQHYSGVPQQQQQPPPLRVPLPHGFGPLPASARAAAPPLPHFAPGTRIFVGDRPNEFRVQTPNGGSSIMHLPY